MSCKHGTVLGKREDENEIGSYKIRWALYAISQLSPEQRKRWVVCASAGNHAQWVAYACKLMWIQWVIYMPRTTDAMKVRRVKEFGDKYIEVKLVWDYFDQAQKAAKTYQRENRATFVHPFNDRDVIIGQSTVTAEILRENPRIHNLVYPVGGGGLMAGGIMARDALGSSATIIGVEPDGAASMTYALARWNNDTLKKVNRFVGWAAVAQVGKNTFRIAQKSWVKILRADEWLVARTMLDFHDIGEVVEPAGALGLSGVHVASERLRGDIATIVSGRCVSPEIWPEALRLAEKYSGRRMVLDIIFPQRDGALKWLLALLPEGISISGFQYHKGIGPSSPARIEFEGEPQALGQVPFLIKKAGFAYSEAE